MQTCRSRIFGVSYGNAVHISLPLNSATSTGFPCLLLLPSRCSAKQVRTRKRIIIAPCDGLGKRSCVLHLARVLQFYNVVWIS